MTASPPRFVGRVALVSGAASGIGQATARLFAADGAMVYCADRDLAGCQRTASDINEGRAVEQHGSAEAAFHATRARPGDRFAEPEEIGQAILYLASDAAAKITGIELVIDNGYVL